MNNYVKLNNEPDSIGYVDFIANKSKRNYVNLGGINTREAIDCIHAFLCKNEVWSETDCVIHTKKPFGFVPDFKYHNISFVIKFYKDASNNKDIIDKMNHELELIDAK